MKKIIIRNCPSIGWSKKLFKKCKSDCTNHKPSDCSEIPDCLIKRIYEKFKDCNCELIKYLEIEEIND